MTSRHSATIVVVRLLALCVLVLTFTAAGAGTATRHLSIRVSGNRLVDAYGRTVRLLGVNRSSFEFLCSTGRGLY